MGKDKAKPIMLNQFHEYDGGRAKNGTQPKQYGPQCKTGKRFGGQILICMAWFEVSIFHFYNSTPKAAKRIVTEFPNLCVLTSEIHEVAPNHFGEKYFGTDRAEW